MSIDRAPIHQPRTKQINHIGPGPLPGAERARTAGAVLPDDPVDLNDAGNQGTPGLTVIVPTRDERAIVEMLLARLGPAVAPLRAELIIVDDSDDETPEALAEVAGACPVPVRLLHRPPGSRKGGLGSAVVAGARHARADWVLVMDADLQHPPETAAVLASTAMRHDCDIVVGSRYAGDRSAAEGLGSASRVFVSSAATRLAKDKK